MPTAVVRKSVSAVEELHPLGHIHLPDVRQFLSHLRGDPSLESLGVRVEIEIGGLECGKCSHVRLISLGIGAGAYQGCDLGILARYLRGDPCLRAVADTHLQAVAPFVAPLRGAGRQYHA